MPATLDDCYLPDFCDARSVAVVVVVCQLLAFVLVAAQIAAVEPAGMRLLKVSLFLHWLGLTSAGVLCLARAPLARRSTGAITVAAFALIVATTVLLSVAAWYALRWTGYGHELGGAEALLFAARNAAVAAIVAAVLLNARYVPIGISVASIFPGSPARRFVDSQLIVDESWAVAGQGGRFRYRRLVGAGLVLYAAWNLGTVVGVVGGDRLGDPRAIGLDAAFGALFLALLLPYVRTRRSVGAALASAAIAVSLTPLVPAGVPIVAAAAVCLWGLRA